MALCVLEPNSDSDSWHRPSFSQQPSLPPTAQPQTLPWPPVGSPPKHESRNGGWRLVSVGMRRQHLLQSNQSTKQQPEAGDGELWLEITGPRFTWGLCRRVRGLTFFFKPGWERHLAWQLFMYSFVFMATPYYCVHFTKLCYLKPAVLIKSIIVR